MQKRLLMAACLLGLGAASARAELSVGDEAPKITVDKWFNLPAGMKGISQNDLKGKILMVEFWATW